VVVAPIINLALFGTFSITHKKAGPYKVPERTRLMQDIHNLIIEGDPYECYAAVADLRRTFLQISICNL
jgi:hypothetical protein